MHTCPSPKLFLQNLHCRLVSYSLVHLQSTCNQFHVYSALRGGLVRISTLALHGGLMRNVPEVCKTHNCFQLLYGKALAQLSQIISIMHIQCIIQSGVPLSHYVLCIFSTQAMSTFSPIGLWSSNGMKMCVCVCVCVHACMYYM